MDLYSDSEWWAVRREYGEIISYDPCESKEDAEEFIRDWMDGKGEVMTREELVECIRDKDEREWDISDDYTVYPEE